MSIEVSVFDAFGPAEAQWRYLEGSSVHYGFQCFDWLATWQETVGTVDAIRPCIVIAREAGQPVALFPFGIWRQLGARVLGFLGAEQVDYNAPLLHQAYLEPARFEVLWRTVERHLPVHDVRLFVRMPEVLNVSGPENPCSRIVPTVGTDRAYLASLPDDWDTFSKRLSAQFRSNTGRKWRRLATTGNLRLVVADTPDRTRQLLDAVFHQKIRRLQETGARVSIANAEIRNFYCGLPQQLGAKGRVHLSGLMLDDRVLAAHLGMVYENRFYWLLPTFVGGEWERYSTGRLLLEQLLRRSIGEHIEYFDFTVGGEAYKNTWSDREMALYTGLKTVSLRGIPFALAYRLVRWIKTNSRTRAFAMGLVRLLRGTTPEIRR